MVGKTVGKYRFIEKLGRGAMGTVYKAVDETLDREVAIKILNPDLGDIDVMKRFRAEASMLAKLNHPAIATIYELHRTDDDLLMVMEFVRGESLDQLVQRGGPLDPEHAAYLLAQVLDAIGHAHAAGVIHRDLKPSNVMVTENGGAKIMDFGIARVRGAEHMTSDGFMVGTPAYMSPEQVLCHEVDGRSDLYSVGVMFYRLLTGKLPFQADTAIGMVQKQISDMPTPARRHRAELPAWTLTILDQALAKSPADRYQTAEEFRSALLDAINGGVAEATSVLSSGLLAPPKSAVRKPHSAVDTSIATALSPAPVPPPPVTPPAVVAPALPPTVAAPQDIAPPPVALKPPVAAPPKKSAFGLVATLVALVTIGALVVGIALMRSRAAKPATPESSDAALSTPAPVAAAPASPAPEPAAPPVPPPAPPPVDTTAAPVNAAPSAPDAPPTRPARAARGAKPPEPVPAPVPVPETPAPPVVAEPAPVAPPFTFAAKMLVRDGDKQRERDATVRFADGQVTVTAQDRTILSALPLDAVLSVIYSKAKQPLWDAPGGATPIQKIDGGAFGFLKGGRHWVSLRTKERFVVLRVDENQVPGVLSAIEERTGKTTVRVAEPKGNQ